MYCESVPGDILRKLCFYLYVYFICTSMLKSNKITVINKCLDILSAFHLKEKTFIVY